MPENSNLYEKIKNSLESQEQPTVTILSSLLAIQDTLHYIPKEGISETAKFCGKSTNEVWSVASFYTNFRFTPPGEKVLDVCWGPTCHLLGAQKIIDNIQKIVGARLLKPFVDFKNPLEIIPRITPNIKKK